MIPKIIHYCWFGYNEKPKEIEKCIDSWRKFFPDWEIKEWTEDNFDIEKYQYAKEAYALKKWAFVSDIVRFDVLYEFGGIYLDVDVEFIKPLPKEFLEYTGFCGFEHTSIIAPGLIFGIEKENALLKEILDSFKEDHFEIRKDGIYKTINLRVTEKLEEMGLVKNNEFQNINGIRIFPSEYFCGYNTDIREPEITDKTICWHHYLGSWSTPSLKMKCQNLLKKVIGVTKYKKLLMFVRFVRSEK